MPVMPTSRRAPGTAPRCEAVSLSRRAVGASAALTVLAGWGLGMPSPCRAAHVVKPWPGAKAVPPLDLMGLDGKRWRLEPTGGRVVVVNFWATWCEPCRTEMPSLQALAQRRRRDGLTVIAVNYRETAEVVQQFLARVPFKVPILLDADGEATTAWTPRVFPSTVIVGRDGQPMHTVLGDLDWGGDEARQLLDPLLGQQRRRAGEQQYP